MNRTWRIQVFGYSLSLENLSGHDGDVLQIMTTGGTPEIQEPMFVTPDGEVTTFDDIVPSTTGINSISPAEANDAPSFDLQGRKTTTETKGVIVSGGKKYVAK